MGKHERRIAFTLLSIAAALLGVAPSENRSCEEIVAEFDRLSESFNSRPPDPSLEHLRALIKEHEARTIALALELYRIKPDHERVPQMMACRWMALCNDASNSESLPKEIDEILSKRPVETLRLRGSYCKARVLMLEPGRRADAMTAINEFIRLEGSRGEQAPQLLFSFTRKLPDRSALRARLEERIQREYPESDDAKLVAGLQRRRSELGKPFILNFQDAISGRKVSIEGMRGKVVVLDFWATWCHPCAVQIPHLKELYLKYHDRGVEFIGVSLDRPVEQGGLADLKGVVSKYQIPWPQFYQNGNASPGDSEFSSSWGIDGIPAVFVLDGEGRLASNGWDKPLEQILPELLKRSEPGVDEKVSAGDPAQQPGHARGKLKTSAAKSRPTSARKP